ncbi:MAG: gamma-glutamyltransferase [Alphaproteobacteria bacterium]|jgi:gamma-glutamyltranspeptidase/glutathione hydrolase|nr:gamma-glutamyltransferase [Alphaproteobacteria bacterium]
MRDLQLPGRSTMHGVNGMAATSHPLSTLAAIDVLREGGNAVDAAVTACAVQCVVEPMSTGIGGDCFVLYVKGGEGEVKGLNGSGWAPKGLNADWLLEQGIDSIEATTPHAVTVPGAIDAWETTLADHGTWGLDKVLQPAIRYAEDGWAVTPRVAVDWQRGEEKLHLDEAAREQYLVDGRAPRVGERFHLPKLAKALRTIAEEGRQGFYEGWVAEDLVACLQAKGGRHALDDFAEQRCEYVEPISTRYGDHDIFQIPPNGQGITALMMLNILSGYDLARLDPVGVERLHLEVEAARLAYQARDVHVADQRYAQVPVGQMLSAEFADELRAKISPDRAMAVEEGYTGPVYRDTVYLTVVDKDRNTCSFINSLFFGFGSGIVGPESGIMLQNRGSGFRVEPGHANCIAPRKRPMHTIIPGMCMKDGRVACSYGVMGGGFQPTGHTHVLTNMIDFGMDPQEALDCPRVFHIEGRVDVERGLGEDVMDGLAALGHEVGRPEMPWGGGQIIAVDWENGTLAGGSEPRKDGCALGY